MFCLVRSLNSTSNRWNYYKILQVYINITSHLVYDLVVDNRSSIQVMKKPPDSLPH
jgi:hypothetical protein